MNAKRHHIVMISNTAFSMWNFRRHVMADFIQAGHKVTCLATPDDTTPHIQSLGVEFIPLTLSRSGTNLFNEIFLIKKIYSHLKKLKPNFIITYTIKPNTYVPPLAKFLRIPCLAVVTGLGYAFIKENIIAHLARNIFRLGLKCASKIWFLNNDDRDVVCKKSLCLLGKSAILPGEGIDINHFNDQSFTSPTSSSFVFLVIARILKDKGIYEFSDAAKIIKQKYSNVEFHVLGAIDEDNPAGLSPSEWESVCHNSGLIYKGTASDVRPYIAASHVCVLPSYREGIPFSLLEAGAMRKPLIATDVAGCRDVVKQNENGFLVKVRDVQDLAAAMERMITMDEKSFSEMKDRSRNIICNEFCTEKVIQKYRDLLK